MPYSQENLNTAVIDHAVGGNNTIVAAPTTPGNWLAIDFVSFVPVADNTITFLSGATPKSGPIPLAAGQGLTWENATNHPDGIITCAPNQAFVITLLSGTKILGAVRYREVGN